MEKSIILQVKTTEKNGVKYKSAYLVVDLDYTRKTLTWNKQDIAEILGISVYDLMTMENGNYKVGSIVDNDKDNKKGG